ncbi:hypothetical protein G6F61_013782 [Rhizopus arrhizus]|nr:hypothetical protein G6F61_013782 [Rhizopus arrhizus]
MIWRDCGPGSCIACSGWLSRNRARRRRLANAHRARASRAPAIWTVSSSGVSQAIKGSVAASAGSCTDSSAPVPLSSATGNVLDSSCSGAACIGSISASKGGSTAHNHAPSQKRADACESPSWRCNSCAPYQTRPAPNRLAVRLIIHRPVDDRLMAGPRRPGAAAPAVARFPCRSAGGFRRRPGSAAARRSPVRGERSRH